MRIELPDVQVVIESTDCVSADFAQDILCLLRRVFPKTKFKSLLKNARVFALRDPRNYELIACIQVPEEGPQQPWRDLELKWVTVSPQYRRLNYGRQLMQIVINYYQPTTASVVLNPPTEEAKAFYRSLGFKEVK
jgi:ribosomal protein S18 acetylase RimI-like enzyme